MKLRPIFSFFIFQFCEKMYDPKIHAFLLPRVSVNRLSNDHTLKNMVRYTGYLLNRSSTDSTKLRIPQEKNFWFYSFSNLRNAYGIR